MTFWNTHPDPEHSGSSVPTRREGEEGESETQTLFTLFCDANFIL